MNLRSPQQEHLWKVMTCVAHWASLKGGMKRINTSVFKEECCLLNWRVVQTWGTSCSESWARKMWDGMGYTIGIKFFKEVKSLNLKVIQIGGTCFSESQAKKCEAVVITAKHGRISTVRLLIYHKFSNTESCLFNNVDMESVSNLPWQGQV